MKIRKHTRGNYYTTITINKEKKFIYGSTPEEVEQKYAELRYKHGKGYNITRNPVMKEYMTQWYNVYKKGEGAIKTQDMYKNCINNHINPVLGTKRVRDITTTQVQKLLKDIKGSKSLVHKVRITLNQIFNAAMADKIIDSNPVINTKIIAPDQPKRVCLNPIQRELMLNILKEDRFYPIAFTILYTGMRMGEIIALTWNDIDLDVKIIHVTKAVEFKNSIPKLKEPKTKRGYRTIPIPDELLKFLKEHKARTKGIYVFPYFPGRIMTLTQITRVTRQAKEKIEKWFENEDNEEMKQHKFNLTYRLLRHTYCTGLYDAGIDELSAAEIMGHDVNIMRSVYTHILDARKKKTIQKLDSIYKSND